MVVVAGTEDGDFLSSGEDSPVTIYGGAGDDTIYGSTDGDLIFGEAGDDQITGVLLGPAGLVGLHGDTIFGGDGNDWINGIAIAGQPNSNDRFFGGNGNDWIAVYDGSGALIQGDAGDDILHVFGGSGHTLLGGDGDDSFAAVWQDRGVTFFGGAGLDRLEIDRGQSTGNEILFNDRENGWRADLTDGSVIAGIELLKIWTGSGDDHLTIRHLELGEQNWWAQGGSDTAIIDLQDMPVALGPSGDIHTLFSNVDFEGFRWMHLAGVEHFQLYGGSGDDSVNLSQAESGFAYGGGGNDRLEGGPTTSLLYGGAGDDFIQVVGHVSGTYDGGAGDDTISTIGTGGTLIGGEGVDRLELDRSADRIDDLTFVIDPSAPRDMLLSDGTSISGFETVTLQLGEGAHHGTFLLTGPGTQRWSGGGANSKAVIDGSMLTEAMEGSHRIVGIKGTFGKNPWDSMVPGTGVMLGNIGHVEILGGSGDDLLWHTEGTDTTIHGNAGDDRLRLRSGVLYGGDGDDHLAGETGTFDGGDGIDTLALTRRRAEGESFTVDASGKGQVTLADGTVIAGIEALDLTTSSSGNRVTFTNLGGETQIWTSNGGNDTAILDLSHADFAIRMGTVGFDAKAPIRIMRSETADLAEKVLAYLYWIEQVEIRAGSANDALYGDERTETFFGNAGDDTIDGRSGADRIYGGAGDDTLSGDGISDVWFYGGDGDDTIRSSRGLRTEVYGGDGNDLITTNVHRLSAAQETYDGGAGHDRLVIDHRYSAADETFVADGTGEASFTLSDGTIVRGFELLAIQTGSGNDTATFTRFSAGEQSWDGGEGEDTATLDFSEKTEGISVSGSQHYLVAHNEEFSIRLTSVETIHILGGHGDDSLWAHGSGDETLRGEGGSDILTTGSGSVYVVPEGSGGRDSLFGGAGDDILRGLPGSGGGLFDGGEGLDRLELDRSRATTALRLDFDGRSGASNQLADGTRIDSVELLHFKTGDGDDRLGLRSDRMSNGEYRWNGGAGHDIAVLDFSRLDAPVYVGRPLDGFGPHLAGTHDGNGEVDLNRPWVSLTNVEEIHVSGGSKDDIIDTAAYFAAPIDTTTHVGSVSGNGGNDQIYGGIGADTFFGGAGNDTIDAWSGADRIYGGAGADVITSWSGGLEIAILDGGAGNDTYTIYHSATRIVERAKGGMDRVFAYTSYDLAGTHVEQLTLFGPGQINGFGNSLNNTITGNAWRNTLRGLEGNDTLIGKAGGDLLEGGRGNDTYVVSDVRDRVVELANSGTDHVMSEVSFRLSAHVENLTLTGIGRFMSDRLTGWGNALDNRLIGSKGYDALYGGAGNDTLDGGASSDYLAGGKGNDLYIVDSMDDRIVEAKNAGVDHVRSSGDFILEANLEHLTLTGKAALTGTGNGLANVITGNSGANILTGNGGNDRLIGGAGADRLFGGAGADSLYGGAGNDTLEGGAGSDVLQGGAGRDVFVFRETSEAGARAKTHDRILDFNPREGDRIDLRLIDAQPGGPSTGDQAFEFIGERAFSGRAGELRYQREADRTLILGDVTGDGRADLAIELLSGMSLRSSHFLL